MMIVFSYQLRLYLRNAGDLIALMLFFVLCFSLFPFALGPEPETLLKVAPGIIWIAVLFSMQLALPQLFKEDFEDSSLELLILNMPILSMAILARFAAFWIAICLPLLLVSPLAAMAFNLTLGQGLLLALSIALGSISLCFVGGTIAALTLGSRQAVFLIPLLALPLFVPVLIFAVAAVQAAIQGFSVASTLIILWGFALFFVPLGTYFTGLILAHNIQNAS